MGTAVARSDLESSDLVFYSRSGTAYLVTIYAGVGKVIDAPAPGYTFEKVRLAAMPGIGDYAGARRVIPVVP